MGRGRGEEVGWMGRGEEAWGEWGRKLWRSSCCRDCAFVAVRLLAGYCSSAVVGLLELFCFSFIIGVIIPLGSFGAS